MNAHHPCLKLALVTETWPPEINGVAITLRHLVRGLRERGHAVHLVRPRQQAHEIPAHQPGWRETLVRGLAIPRYDALKLGLPARGQLRELWRSERPDVVHVATEGPLGWSAVNAARDLGLPVTTDFHTNFHSYTRHYGIGWLERPVVAYLRRLHNRTRCTMVPTEELGTELAALGLQNLLVVARGVDTRLFDPARRDLALRRSWGAQPEDPVALFVSRIAPEKNLPLLMETFAALRAADPRTRLVVVGDGPARALLQRRYPAAIYTGARVDEDLATQYASADLFLYPSTSETFGNVTLEAMASGLAVLAYDYAAARMHIRSGVNGLTVPVDDRNAFIHGALTLAREPALRGRLGAAARAAMLTIDWRDIVLEFERALLEHAGAAVR